MLLGPPIAWQIWRLWGKIDDGMGQSRACDAGRFRDGLTTSSGSLPRVRVDHAIFNPRNLPHPAALFVRQRASSNEIPSRVIPMLCLSRGGALLSIVLLLSWACSFSTASESPSDAADPSLPSNTEAEIFDGLPEPLIPKNPLSQEERDKLEAITLFSAARMHQQRQDLPAALRLYQRALRYDPNALPVLEQIVALAFELERTSEAIRYALMAAELQPGRPELLRQLGLHLFGQDDVDGAVRLYEKALSLPQVQASDSGEIQLLAEIGQMYSDLGRFAEAAKAYASVQEYIEQPLDDAAAKRFQETLLKRFGGRDVAYEQFAEAYLEAGEYEDATDAFEKANVIKPDRARLAFNLARVQFRSGDAEQALNTLQAYFEAQGTAFGQEAYELLAKLLADLERDDELLDELEAIRETDSDNESLTLFLAGQLFEADQLDQATQLYEELLDNTGSLAARQGLVHIDQERNDAEALLKHMGLAADQDPPSPMLPADPRQWLGDQADTLIENEALLTAVLDLIAEPAEDEALTRQRNLTLSWLALAAGRTEKAEELFKAGLDESDEQAVGLLREWGLELLGGEQYEAASRWLRRAIDIAGTDDSRPPFEHYYLAGALEMAGDTDEALNIARQGARRAEPFPEWVPMFRSRVAWVAYHARRYELAEELYQALIDDFDDEPASGDVRDVLRNARLVLSNLDSINGNLEEAKEWLEQVLDEFPEDISAQNDLGYLWADEGINLDRALEMIRNAVDAEPDNPAYRDSLGWVLYRLERYEEALVEMQKAADTEEPDGVILDHLGDVHLGLGNVEEARESWQRALELFDPEYDAEYIEQTTEKLAAHPGSTDE